MTARVSAEEVKSLIATDLSDDVVMATFVDTANLLVDEHLLTAGHSARLLTKIELYLSAHLLALKEELGGLTRSKYGDADDSFANVYGDALKSTRFGQVVLTLDDSGILAGVGTTTLRAEFRVV